jgi:uncharacterized membrane protein YhaH (DUF805 family)
MEYRPSKLYRASYPRWSTIAPTPFGRTGPYVEPESRTDNGHGIIQFALLIYFGPRLLIWLANQIDGTIAARTSELLTGIQHPVLHLLGFAALASLLIYTVGHTMWSIRRLHDLGRPAWHLWKSAMHFLLALSPPVILGIVIWNTSEMPLAEAIGTGWIFGGILWVAPYSLAFWAGHIGEWQASVEEAPGEPGPNRYGPPPERASDDSLAARQ